MIRRMVLLPEPEGPRSATSCPAGTSNETSFTAWNDPKRFVRFFATILIDQDLSVSDGTGYTDPHTADCVGLWLGNDTVIGRADEQLAYDLPSRAAMCRRVASMTIKK